MNPISDFRMAESKRLLLRLSPRLFDALHRWADDELRSINGQIEYLLTDQARRAGRLARQSSRRPPTDPPADDVGDPEADDEPSGCPSRSLLAVSPQQRADECRHQDERGDRSARPAEPGRYLRRDRCVERVGGRRRG